MNSIYLIKIFNLITLMLIPLNYIFGFIGFSGINGFVYGWACFIGFAINYFREKKSKLMFLMFLVLYFPVVTSKSMDELLYIAIFCSLTILIILRTVGNVSYIMELDMFRKGRILCIGTFVLSIVLDDIGNFAVFSGYFVIIYLVTSILLLRSLRLAEFVNNNREASKINNRYSIVIILFSFILSSEYLRGTLVKVVKSVYHYIVDLFFFLFSWVFTGIYYYIAKVLNKLISKLEMKEPKLETSGEIDFTFNSNNVKSLAEKLQNNEILKTIINVLVILLAVFIVVKFFSKYINRKSKREEYLEESEFILNPREGRKKLKDRILSLIKPKSSEEKIRQYYLRYMSKCQDKHIELKETDTTEDIRNKSKKKFDEALIDSIRNIYIRVRYGEEKASREEVRDMAEYLENIKKQ